MDFPNSHLLLPISQFSKSKMNPEEPFFLTTVKAVSCSCRLGAVFVNYAPLLLSFMPDSGTGQYLPTCSATYWLKCTVPLCMLFCDLSPRGPIHHPQNINKGSERWIPARECRKKEKPRVFPAALVSPLRHFQGFMCFSLTASNPEAESLSAPPHP